MHILISDDMTQIEIERFIQKLGLDRPVHEQYFHFLGNAARGDLGNSFVFGEPALKLILQRMPATLELAFAAFLLAIVFGIPLGMYAGPAPRVAGEPRDHGGLDPRLLAADLLGRPDAHHGVRGDARLAALDRARRLHDLGRPRHLALPAINLALFKMALVTRLARAGTREAALQDYVKFARAKGLSPARVVLVHVLKNILVPVVTVLGLELGGLIAFSVVTETVFAWPGMGKLLIDSIQRLDRPVIVAYLVITVLMFVVINLVVDMLYSALDPRVRLKEARHDRQGPGAAVQRASNVAFGSAPEVGHHERRVEVLPLANGNAFGASRANSSRARSPPARSPPC